MNETRSLIRRIRRLSIIMRRSSAARLLRGKTGQLAVVFIKPIGRKMLLRVGTSDLLCLEKVFLDHEYESSLDTKPKFIVDAGANIGAATLFYAHKFPEARIIALEPEASNFALLKKNCHGLSNVVCLNAALWSSDGKVRIADPVAEKWAFTVASAPENGDVAAISMQTLMNVCNLPRVDILKLDIEGAELELFSIGYKKWLEKVGSIVIELHDRAKPGCAQAFYSACVDRKFTQEVRGENIFVRLDLLVSAELPNHENLLASADAD